MIKYDQISFLEYFDEEKVIDKQNGIFEYNVKTSQGLVLCVYLDVIAKIVSFRWINPKFSIDLLNFSLPSILQIVCDNRNPRSIRFLFYQKNKEEPIAYIWIKPELALSLELEKNIWS